MRRKKDDKRVLRAGNGRDTRSSRKFNKRRYKSNNNRYVPPTRQKKKSKRSGKTVLLMILVLVAFIIGAGIGIALSFEDPNSDNNTTQIENVTVEMTTHLNETPELEFGEEDYINYNENQSLGMIDEEQYTIQDDYNY